MYPWLTQTMNDLLARHERDRLPHALLISGQAGLGKLVLAETLAQYLLCRENTACGRCKTCLLMAAGSHPDFQLIQPEEDSRQIKIEQIRSLTDWVNQTAQMGARKVAVLNPAHAMNRNSSNALLKAMEEPPANTHLILVSDDPATLLPTIRSRCQVVSISVPDPAVAIPWLAEQGGANVDWALPLKLCSGSPLHAKDRFDEAYMAKRVQLATVWLRLFNRESDVVSLVAELAKVEPGEVIELGMSMLADVARRDLDAGENAIQNSDIVQQTGALSEFVGSRHALAAIDRMQTDYRLLKGSQNPNKTLLLERLMMDCLTLEEQRYRL